MIKKSVLFSLLFLILISFISSSELRVTNEHPFLVDNEWIHASDLKVGDELRTVDGRIARITSIEDIVEDENISVYNLEAGSYHNFVVSDNDDEVEEWLVGDGEGVGLVDNSNDVAGRGWGGEGLVVHNSDALSRPWWRFGDNGGWVLNPFAKKTSRNAPYLGKKYATLSAKIQASKGFEGPHHVDWRPPRDSVKKVSLKKIEAKMKELYDRSSLLKKVTKMKNEPTQANIDAVIKSLETRKIKVKIVPDGYVGSGEVYTDKGVNGREHFNNFAAAIEDTIYMERGAAENLETFARELGHEVCYIYTRTIYGNRASIPRIKNPPPLMSEFIGTSANRVLDWIVGSGGETVSESLKLLE